MHDDHDTAAATASETASAATESVQTRFQFSLRTLLILIAALALLMSLARAMLQLHETNAELASAQLEIRRLKIEAGHFPSVDKSKVNLLALQSLTPLKWKWRIYLPKGTRYKINYTFKDISPEGVPNKAGGLRGYSLDTPEEGAELTLHLAKDFDGNGMRYVDDSSGSTSGMGKLDAEIIRTQLLGPVSWSQAGNRAPATFDPEEPIVLLRFRPQEGSDEKGWAPATEPTPGIMVWLTPLPKK